MKILLILFFSITLLFGAIDTNLQKQLSSADRAGVYLENLFEAGELEEAKSFLQLANAKYHNDADILCWSGKVYADLNNLEMAKKYFIRALDIDPTHHLARIQLELIKEQEAAHTNEDMDEVMGFLSDKGLDFLMIFLAFLGGEIIAKRYNVCKNRHIYVMAEHFINKKSLSSSPKSRLKLTLSHYLKQEFFSFCFIINFLVILTISIALMIFWLLVAFYFEFTWLLDEPLSTVDLETIMYYLLKVFTIAFVSTIVTRGIMNYINLPKNETLYDIEFIEELDMLYSNLAYTDIYDVLEYVKASGVSKEEIKKLLSNYSQEAEAIIKFY